MKNLLQDSRGEIATIIAIGSLIVIGIGTIVSATLMNQNEPLTTGSRASENACTREITSAYVEGRNGNNDTEFECVIETTRMNYSNNDGWICTVVMENEWPQPDAQCEYYNNNQQKTVNGAISKFKCKLPDRYRGKNVTVKARAVVPNDSTCPWTGEKKEHFIEADSFCYNCSADQTRDNDRSNQDSIRQGKCTPGQTIDIGDGRKYMTNGCQRTNRCSDANPSQDCADAFGRDEGDTDPAHWWCYGFDDGPQCLLCENCGNNQSQPENNPPPPANNTDCKKGSVEGCCVTHDAPWSDKDGQWKVLCQQEGKCDSSKGTQATIGCCELLTRYSKVVGEVSNCKEGHPFLQNFFCMGNIQVADNKLSRNTQGWGDMCMYISPGQYGMSSTDPDDDNPPPQQGECADWCATDSQCSNADGTRVSRPCTFESCPAGTSPCNTDTDNGSDDDTDDSSNDSNCSRYCGTDGQYWERCDGTNDQPTGGSCTPDGCGRVTSEIAKGNIPPLQSSHKFTTKSCDGPGTPCEWCYGDDRVNGQTNGCCAVPKQSNNNRDDDDKDDDRRNNDDRNDDDRGDDNGNDERDRPAGPTNKPRPTNTPRPTSTPRPTNTPESTPTPTPEPEPFMKGEVSETGCGYRGPNWCRPGETCTIGWIPAKEFNADGAREYGISRVQCSPQEKLVNTIKEGLKRHDNQVQFKIETKCVAPEEGEACPTAIPLQGTSARLTLSVGTNKMIDTKTEFGQYSVTNDFTVTLERGGNKKEQQIEMRAQEGFYAGTTKLDISGGTYSISIKHKNTNAVVFEGVELEPGDVLDCSAGTRDSACGDLSKWKSDEYRILLGDANTDGDIDDSDRSLISENYGQSVPDGTYEGAKYSADLNKDGKIDGIDIAAWVNSKKILDSQ